MKPSQVWQWISSQKLWTALKLKRKDITSQKNGVIIKQSVCQQKHQTYEQFIEKRKKLYLSELEYARQRNVVMQSWEQLVPCLPDKKEFEHKKAYVGFECKRIKYWSDGLKVIGYIWKPKNIGDRKLPLIIVNRE